MVNASLHTLGELAFLLLGLLSGIPHTTPDRLATEAWPVATRIVVVHGVPDSEMVLLPGEQPSGRSLDHVSMLNGNIRCAWTSHCGIRLAERATADTLPHEMEHARDALTDGVMDGRLFGLMPFPRPVVQPAWCADWCWESGIEWIPSAAEHHRRLW